jgi:DNA-binding transcriptional MerR regulator
MGEDRRELLRIGEVAEAAGTTPRTIRYYEEIGVLPAAGGRARGSHRMYEREDVERLRELLELRDLLGVSLEELRDLASAESARSALRREWQEGVDDPSRRRAILDQAAGHIDRQLELTRRRRDQIAALESELVTRRRRVTKRLRELEREPSAARR